MTGAKLLGMHETVSSPTEYRSHLLGDAAVVEGSYADDGRVQALEGNLRQKTAASGRHRVGWPRAMLERNLQGLDCYPT